MGDGESVVCGLGKEKQERTGKLEEEDAKQGGLGLGWIEGGEECEVKSKRAGGNPG
jgi:hypothetical protein